MVRLLAGGWRPVVLPIAVVSLDLVLFSTLLHAGTPAGPRWLVLGYALVGGALLAWQRRSPLPGYAALWLHAVGAVALSGYRPTLPLLVALYGVAAHATRRSLGLLALLAATGPIGLAVLDGVQEAPPDEVLATIAGLSTLLLLVHCGAYAIGLWARQFRRRARALENDRDSAARHAVEVERARLANELHDIVGHSVTLMTVQAAGARKVMHRDPARADQALARISGAGAQTVSELRRVLGGLRPGELSSLHHLDDLFDRIRPTGVSVGLTSTGTPVRLTPAVDLVAYRVVQEALTNVVKHAGPGSHAAVVLGWQPHSLSIEVTDDGLGRPPDDAAHLCTGQGLAGLDDRVTAAGGQFEAAGTAGGGFRVRADIPMQPARSQDVAAYPAG